MLKTVRERRETAGWTWLLYVLWGWAVVWIAVESAGECWAGAVWGTILGWSVGALFLAYYADHLRESLDKWGEEREVARENRRIRRIRRRQERRKSRGL